MRSRKGNVYWQVGHETLKNAASTGPCCRADCKENLPPSFPSTLPSDLTLTNAGKEKSGALVPAGKAAISVGPPNKRSSHFIDEMPHPLDDAARFQDFPRQPGDGNLREAVNGDPSAPRSRQLCIPYHMNSV